MEIGNLTEKEKGYLFGLFEGDGYKYHNKNSRHYHVEFYLNSEKDKEIISFLVKILIKIGLKPNLYQDKRYNCKRVRVYSKELFNYLIKGSSLVDKGKDFSIGFISGIIDSEGHVDKAKSSIAVVNTDKQLLEKCRDLLEGLGIDAKINKRVLSLKDNKFSYRMYIPVSFKNKAHLSIKTKRLQS
ncbi:hypothetical protein GOV13_05700 [Candidatus Pacearchaeota archaeon]|nr:hypothetical protein [Candidatus Pacearchaeota archaeon]